MLHSNSTRGVAALVPQPWAHRHRKKSVCAPNVLLRSVVTTLATVAGPPVPTCAAPSEAPRNLAVARYLWAMWLARLYEGRPLRCPIDHSQMPIIALHRRCRHRDEDPRPPRRIRPASTQYRSACATAAGGGSGGTGAQRFSVDSSAQPAAEIASISTSRGRWVGGEARARSRARQCLRCYSPGPSVN